MRKYDGNGMNKIPEKIFREFLNTQVGVLEIVADKEALLCVNFVDTEKRTGAKSGNEITSKTKQQLKEYFSGKRKEFSIPLKLNGTLFQKKVWEALRQIPYGETRSYSDIALQTGSPKAARAIGLANNKNPIAVIVPCHRVIGKNGKLVGYAGGLWRKKRLLELERKFSFRD